jgi:hypothetical protein
VSSLQLDPGVIDASTLTPRQTSAIYLPIGIEGQADNVGTGVVATPVVISRNDQAEAIIGPAATNVLSRHVQAMINAGAGPIKVVISAKGTTPTVGQRQTAWATLESDTQVRLRLTDSAVQSDLVALAASASSANLVYNKQVAILGMPSGTAKAALISAAAAIASGDQSRAVLVAPGVYDSAGVLRSGNYAAAVVAAEVAKNADPAMDLDLWNIPNITGVELDTAGLPVFRRKIVTGAAVNDYEDLLDAGVSPLQPSRVPGGVMTTHLRTTYITNTQWDNLYTRIIVDQIFLDVKAYILDNNFLRAGNTDATRARIASGVDALLKERSAWISPIVQGDGTTGYGVIVTASPDLRQVTVGYQGTVVRGINTVQVAANLTITV